MLSLHCNKCDSLIGSYDLFCFYQQSICNSLHLTVKYEKQNESVNNFIIKEQEIEKKKKFQPFELYCLNSSKCNNKVGVKSPISIRNIFLNLYNYLNIIPFFFI